MDISINGSDTIQINGRLLTNFFDKDYGMLTFPNELANFKIGKDGNAAINFMPSGLVGELTLRILVGTYDDQFVNSIQLDFVNDAPSFILADGQVIKRSGRGDGSIRNVVYNLTGGVPIVIPEERSNADGDEEQAVAVWKFRFALASRQIL